MMDNKTALVTAAMSLVEPPKFLVGEKETEHNLKYYSHKVSLLVDQMEKSFPGINWYA